jgi:Immunity protein 35
MIMLTLEKAERLAALWVELMTDGDCVIQYEQTIARPYGWIFLYQSKEYLNHGRFEDMSVGNALIIVDRVDGEIIVTGTAKPLEEYIKEYESTLPPARLLMSPER